MAINNTPMLRRDQVEQDQPLPLAPAPAISESVDTNEPADRRLLHGMVREIARMIKAHNPGAELAGIYGTDAINWFTIVADQRMLESWAVDTYHKVRTIRDPRGRGPHQIVPFIGESEIRQLQAVWNRLIYNVDDSTLESLARAACRKMFIMCDLAGDISAVSQLGDSERVDLAIGNERDPEHGASFREERELLAANVTKRDSLGNVANDCYNDAIADLLEYRASMADLGLGASIPALMSVASAACRSALIRAGYMKQIRDSYDTAVRTDDPRYKLMLPSPKAAKTNSKPTAQNLKLSSTTPSSRASQKGSTDQHISKGQYFADNRRMDK